MGPALTEKNICNTATAEKKLTLGQMQELFMQLLPGLISKAHALGFSSGGGGGGKYPKKHETFIEECLRQSEDVQKFQRQIPRSFRALMTRDADAGYFSHHRTKNHSIQLGVAE